jgi:uncharacterized protein (TIGR02596 family)
MVELLVVMAIVGILMALTIPAVTSALNGSNLTRAGQQVADQINLAHQMASARNITVEMRVFQPPGGTGYTTLQMGTNSTTGLWVPVSYLINLPKNIVIASSPSLTTAFSTYTALTMTNAGTTYNYSYYPFEFRPSGIVTPTLPITNYCFAVVPSKYTSASSLSSVQNYAIVQINPVTGTPLIYRP